MPPSRVARSARDSRRKVTSGPRGGNVVALFTLQFATAVRGPIIWAGIAIREADYFMQFLIRRRRRFTIHSEFAILTGKPGAYYQRNSSVLGRMSCYDNVT